ncbi:MAG: hypothetical protein WAM82_27600 [Thermoanaerobaculia bacterium]
MNPDLSHVRVTVIDFMGVFLPGTAWLLLLCTLNGVLSSASPTNPIEVAKPLFYTIAPKLGASFYVIALIATLIAGYIAKALAIKPLERLTTLFDSRWARLRRAKLPQEAGVHKEFCATDYRFPYDVRHRNTPYYEAIKSE